MESLRQFDRAVLIFLNGTCHREWLDPFFWLMTSTGLGQVQILLAAPLLLAKKVRPLYFQVGAAVLSGLLVHIPKRLIERPRPTTWEQTISAPDELIYGHSFPSGHTMTSFSVATVLACWLWRRGHRWLALLCYVWAGLVGISRIYRGVHWPTDVLAGALLGVAAGLILAWLFTRGERDSSFVVEEAGALGSA